MKNKSSKIRPEVLWFASRMEDKLAKNDHKTHWKLLAIDYLISKLEIEFTELNIQWQEHIYNKYIGKGGSPTNEDIINECIDVANYSMMIANNLIKDNKE